MRTGREVPVLAEMPFPSPAAWSYLEKAWDGGPLGDGPESHPGAPELRKEAHKEPAGGNRGQSSATLTDET